MAGPVAVVLQAEPATLASGCHYLIGWLERYTYGDEVLGLRVSSVQGVARGKPALRAAILDLLLKEGTHTARVGMDLLRQGWDND